MIKHYEVLSLMEEIELIENIEKYCKEQEITIPKMDKDNECEHVETE